MQINHMTPANKNLYFEMLSVARDYKGKAISEKNRVIKLSYIEISKNYFEITTMLRNEFIRKFNTSK